MLGLAHAHALATALASGLALVHALSLQYVLTYMCAVVRHFPFLPLPLLCACLLYQMQCQ